jgi:toxin ParE1/3/4
MNRLVFSPAAQDDFEGIYDYTVEHWGADQAEHYVRELQSACNDLASGKRKGRDASYILPGYFKQPSGAHFIFYKLKKSSHMEVVRVLHQRMDIETHLY